MPNYSAPINEPRSAEGLLLTLLLIFRIETLPNETTGIRIRGKTCLSAASLSFLPNASWLIWGPDQREGSGFAVAFFWLLFLAKQEK